MINILFRFFIIFGIYFTSSFMKKLIALILFAFVVFTQVFSKTQNIIMPFAEDWETHSFATNNWSVSDNGWKIDTNTGNGGASAKFDGDSLYSGYVSYLESDTFNKVDTGKIYLDFDLMLVDSTSSETEWFFTEVFDGTSWTKRDSVSNSGSFSWKNYKYNITCRVKYDDFKIRFKTKGENAANITGWFIDNIKVYSKCDNPENQTGDYIYESDVFGFRVEWDAPELPIGFIPFFGWDNGVNSTSLGLADGGNFTAAIRWDEGQLSEYDGMRLNKVTLFIADASSAYYILKIWTGDSASDLIYQDTLSNIIENQWTVIDINDTILWNADLEYWVGYQVVGQPPNTFPAGIDAGPAVAGYGDMLKNGGDDWIKLSDIGFSNNWNIEIQLVNPQQGPSCFDTLLGFNVYRTFDYDTNYGFRAFVPYQGGVSNYIFKDYDFPSPPYVNNVCYKVNAIWNNGTDTCYSGFAPSLMSPDEDYICSVYDFEKTYGENGDFVLYPNPAKFFVNIGSDKKINGIEIYNRMGQKLISENGKGTKKLTVDVNGFLPGIYIVNTVINGAAVKKKLVVKY